MLKRTVEYYRRNGSHVFAGFIDFNKVFDTVDYWLLFRLDALALSVNSYSDVAGWLAGWLSHSGIVSKPLNLSENFFDCLKAPSL